jgi:aminoglycoside phosphotransferase family enzyme
MQEEEINELMSSPLMHESEVAPLLVDTHISWVILTEQYAYKIKKPVKFAFLDFSTLAKRKHYCERELLLNRRLAADMYIRVLPLYRKDNSFLLQGEANELIEYAVQMKRMDTSLEMDKLLQKNEVTQHAVKNLAHKIAAFHAQAVGIRSQPDIVKLKQRFNDFKTVKKLADQFLGHYSTDIITRAITMSDSFLEKHKKLIVDRALEGYIRDVHGDLHTGNIFLYEDPVVFDCIEFSDELRHMDVLNEVGFLCMDLDARGHQDLSELFYKSYIKYSKMKESKSTLLLLNYYKCYCANIRAKVALLSAANVPAGPMLEEKKNTALIYLNLLKRYLSTEMN